MVCFCLVLQSSFLVSSNREHMCWFELAPKAECLFVFACSLSGGTVLVLLTYGICGRARSLRPGFVQKLDQPSYVAQVCEKFCILS